MRRLLVLALALVLLSSYATGPFLPLLSPTSKRINQATAISSPNPVQSNAGSALGTTMNLAFTTSVTSGNILLVGVAANSSSVTIIDSQGNAWTKKSSANTGSDFADIFYAMAGSNAADTITVHTAAKAGIGLFILEINGYTLNGMEQQVGTGTTANIGTASYIPSTGSFVFSVTAAIASTMSSYTAGNLNGETYTSLGLQTWGAAEYEASSSGGISYQGRATQVGSNAWAVALVSLSMVQTGATTGFNIVTGDPTETSTMSARRHGLFFAQNVWWLWTFENGNWGYHTASTFSGTWSAFTNVSTEGLAGYNFDIWHNSTTVCYAFASQSATVNLRCGAMSTTSSITWKFAERSLTFIYGTLQSPSLAIDSNGFAWIGARSIHNSIIDVELFKDSTTNERTGAFIRERTIAPSGCSPDCALTVFAYQGAAAGDVGIFWSIISGGSASSNGEDWSPTLGWGANYTMTHFEVQRVGQVVIGNTVYVGGATTTGAQAVSFWSHAEGVTTSPTFTNFDLSQTINNMRDTQGTITTDGVSTFVIFFANTENIFPSSTIYYVKSTDLGLTWSPATLLVANENYVWGDPTLMTTDLDSSRSYPIVWEASQTVGCCSFATSASGNFNIRGAELSANEPLQSFTGTLKRSFSQTGFGIDLGTITYSFSQTTIASYDNWTPQHNFSFNIPTVAAQALSLTTSQNSTTVDYHLTKTFAGRTLTGDIYFIQRQYNEKIIISGTITGSAFTFPLAIPFNGATGLSFSSGRQVCVNHLCFDWSDSSSFSPTFNNSTKVLTLTVGNSFMIDPIVKDGNTGCRNTTANPTTSCTTANIAIPQTDVVLLMETGDAAACATPTSSDGLVTFTQRKSLTISGTINECLYWGLDSSNIGHTYTCKYAAATRHSCAVVFFKGADTTTVFDSNGGLPCTAADATGTATSISCTLSTSNANDAIIASMSCDTASAGSGNCDSNPTVQSSFTGTNIDLEAAGVCSGVGGNAECTGSYQEFKIVSSAQTNLAVGYSNLNGANCGLGSCVYGIIVDAIMQAPSTVTQPIKVTMVNGAASATVTINGCSPTPSTFLSDGSVNNIVLNPTCAFTISFSNSGSSQDGFSVSGTFSATSASQTSCASGTCAEIDFTAYLQLLITNVQGLSLTYSSLGTSGLTTTGSPFADFGTSVSATGIYTCAYTIQNASFLNQFVASGVQIWTSSAASAVNDFAVGVNHPLFVTFSETGHVIACIPTATHLTLQNVFANGIATTFSFSSPLLFFSGLATNEIDFVTPPSAQGTGISVYTVIITSAPIISAGIIPVALIGVFAFMYFNEKKKKRSVDYDPKTRDQTGQGWNRNSNGKSATRAKPSGKGVSRASNTGSSVTRSTNQNENKDINRRSNEGQKKKRQW